MGKSTVCLPLCKNNLFGEKQIWPRIHSNSGLGDWGPILPLGFCMTSLTFISIGENVSYQDIKIEVVYVIAFANCLLNVICNYANNIQKTICNYANDIQKTNYLFDCRPAMKSIALFRMIPTETELKSIFSLYFNLVSFPSQFASLFESLFLSLFQIESGLLSALIGAQCNLYNAHKGIPPLPFCLFF